MPTSGRHLTGADGLSLRGNATRSVHDKTTSIAWLVDFVPCAPSLPSFVPCEPEQLNIEAAGSSEIGEKQKVGREVSLTYSGTCCQKGASTMKSTHCRSFAHNATKSNQANDADREQ